MKIVIVGSADEFALIGGRNKFVVLGVDDELVIAIGVSDDENCYDFHVDIVRGAKELLEGQKVNVAGGGGYVEMKRWWQTGSDGLLERHFSAHFYGSSVNYGHFDPVILQDKEIPHTLNGCPVHLFSPYS